MSEYCTRAWAVLVIEAWTGFKGLNLYISGRIETGECLGGFGRVGSVVGL